MVGLQLAVSQVPHLDILIPASRDDDGVGIVGREPDGGNPVLVPILLDSVLALCEGVPELDGLVSASRHNLTVVSRECNRQNILGVILKPPGSLASAEVPQSESFVPRSGKGEVSIRRQHHVRDEMAVTMKSLLWDSVVANVVPGQLPDNERLVSTGGQDHVRVLGVGGDLGHPPIVAPKGPSQLKGLGHGGALRHFLKYYNTRNN